MIDLYTEEEKIQDFVFIRVSNKILLRLILSVLDTCICNCLKHKSIIKVNGYASLFSRNFHKGDSYQTGIHRRRKRWWGGGGAGGGPLPII